LDGSLCRVDLAGGGTLTALAVNVASVGTRTVVSIRPERIVLEPDLAITENVMAGHIEELIYRGSELRVRMKIGGDKQIHATVPIAHATTGLTVGRSIRVGCPAHNCRALRE
jgi:putative spermidine/putrescine transport system ATP-binding protein